MKRATLRWLGRKPNRPSATCRRPNTKCQAVLERLEDRVALSGIPSSGLSIMHSSGPHVVRTLKGHADVSSAVAQQVATLTAGPITYQDPGDGPLPIQAPGVLAYVTSTGPIQGQIYAYWNGPGVVEPKGNLTTNTDGSFTYVPPGYPITSDTFSYAAEANNYSVVSGIAIITITFSSQESPPPPPPTSPGSLLPSTPFFNSLRARRSVDPARFDFFNPRIGTLIGIEADGIPATPTAVVPQNNKFDVTTARSLYAVNPQQYDRNQPILGALFQLEHPGSGDGSLLPQTPFYNEQRALYDSHPSQYQVKHVYMGAIFAIENLEHPHD